MAVLYFFSIFFFQAEDGIRDGHVTGVQTCALPIFGVKLNNSFTSISILGAYAYGGVFNYNSLFNHHKNFAAYQLDYHLIGGGIKLRMRNTEKLYSPTLKFTFLTEITSKYRGGKIIASGSESKDVKDRKSTRLNSSHV